MLKTSGSTESTTRPGKGGVRVGDDGSDNGNHDWQHLPWGSGQAHQRTHQLVRPRLWLSLMGLILVVVLLANWSKIVKKSKNCQKVQKVSKIWKICKGHWFGKTFPKALVFYQQRIWASIKALTVFQAFFAGPRSSLDTIFQLITNKAKRVELFIICCVFPQRSQEDLWAEDTWVFHQL